MTLRTFFSGSRAPCTACARIFQPIATDVLTAAPFATTRFRYVARERFRDALRGEPERQLDHRVVSSSIETSIAVRAAARSTSSPGIGVAPTISLIDSVVMRFRSCLLVRSHRQHEQGPCRADR